MNEILAAPSVTQRCASPLRACERCRRGLNTLLTQASSDSAPNDPVPRPGPQHQPALSHPVAVCGDHLDPSRGKKTVTRLLWRHGFPLD